MKYNENDFDFIFPAGGDREQDCYYERRWVEIRKCNLDPDTTVEVKIPEGVEVIGTNAFINYINLEKITFPSTLTYIREYAFECCKSLKKIEFINPLRIEKNAFRFCDSLETVTVSFSNPRKSFELIWENQRIPGELPGCCISDKNTGLIWNGAFKDCPLLKDVNLCEQMSYFKADENLKKANISGGKLR